MILKLSLEKPLRETNPEIEFEDWFNEFAQLEQTDERFAKAIILFFDYGSPLDKIDDLDTRFQKTQKAIGLSDQEINDFQISIAYPEEENNIHQLINKAIPDYTQYQTDTAKQLKQGMVYQINNLSRQLSSIKLDITADKDDQAIARFQKLSEKSLVIQQNISSLASYEHKDYEEIKNEVEDALAKAESEKESTGIKGINKAKKKRNVQS